MLRRTALAIGLLLGAILIQLIILDNLRLPGGAGPDLVLLTVVALAACAGPVEGMLGGFAAGLALDVAPPASHLVGQYALVFCLVGYVAGVIGADPDQSAWLPLAVVAVGSAVGELLYSLTGLLFGDPDITWTAIGRVLPASIVYDLLLSPFVLYAVARAYGVATQGLAALRGTASQSLLGSPVVAASGVIAVSGSVLRDSGTGGVPRLSARALRAGATQGGSASGGRGPQRAPARPVHLRLGGPGGMQGGSASGTRIPRTLPAAPVQLRLGSRNWASRYRTGLQARPVQLSLGSRNWASRYRTGLQARPVQLRLGSRNWASRYRTGLQARPVQPRLGSRKWASRYRGGLVNGSAAGRSSGLLGDGGGGRALRPSRGPRLRGGVMQGGSASAAQVTINRPVRPVQLRLGSARRRDGAIGGSVLGRRPRSGAFSSGGSLGSAPRWRSAGKAHVPRFRRSKPGTLNGRGPHAGLGGNGRVRLGRRRGWARFGARRLWGKRTGGWR
jgi:rod shape-determining protein MreD